MKAQIRNLFRPLWVRILAGILSLLLIGWVFMSFAYNSMFEWYTGVKNGELTYNTSIELTDAEFEKLAKELTYKERLAKADIIVKDEANEFARRNKTQMLMAAPSFLNENKFDHIKYFRNAGIRQYKGPETCLECHETMKVKKADGSIEEVNTMDDVLETVHYQFQTMAGGMTTYGYDGRQVNENVRAIPVGKIDRACGIPGSFSWTGWAELIETKPEHLHGGTEMRSEGCGQCHIGGNYHPATEKMMPIGDVPEDAKNGIDCLICHSQSYDMNHKYVIEDEVGKRWNQDRTMRAAMTVTKPTNENCLYCHQHNMGGDIYANNVSAKNLGYKNKRLLHEGAKRGNPFHPDTDVHYAAGLKCTDCHIPEGHKIPRGSKGTDLVANDLPGKQVSCESCHTTAPHVKNELTRVILNGHTARIACETCHIKDLQEFNVVLRDWVNPVWNAEEGIYTAADILRTGKTNEGFTFLWFNGNGTFLANPLGNNPNKNEKYNPLMDQLTRTDPSLKERIKQNVAAQLASYNIDFEGYYKPIANTASQMTPDMLQKRKQAIEEKIKPLQDMGESKIYPFKLFNAYMYEDMGNEGPFGAMILPFDYKIYFETGNSKEAVKKAIQNPIVKRMYEYPFKKYMMDDFMSYFGVATWSTEFPLDDKGELRNVKPNWMRQFGALMVNHGIQKDGRQCAECHTPKGIMDYEKLGYPPERVKDLQNVPEIKYVKK